LVGASGFAAEEAGFAVSKRLGSVMGPAERFDVAEGRRAAIGHWVDVVMLEVVTAVTARL